MQINTSRHRERERVAVLGAVLQHSSSGKRLSTIHDCNQFRLFLFRKVRGRGEERRFTSPKTHFRRPPNYAASDNAQTSQESQDNDLGCQQSSNFRCPPQATLTLLPKMYATRCVTKFLKLVINEPWANSSGAGQDIRQPFYKNTHRTSHNPRFWMIRWMLRSYRLHDERRMEDRAEKSDQE